MPPHSWGRSTRTQASTVMSRLGSPAVLWSAATSRLSFLPFRRTASTPPARTIDGSPWTAARSLPASGRKRAPLSFPPAGFPLASTVTDWWKTQRPMSASSLCAGIATPSLGSGVGSAICGRRGLPSPVGRKQWMAPSSVLAKSAPLATASP